MANFCIIIFIICISIAISDLFIILSEKEEPSLLSVTLTSENSNSIIASFSQPLQVCATTI